MSEDQIESQNLKAEKERSEYYIKLKQTIEENKKLQIKNNLPHVLPVQAPKESEKKKDFLDIGDGYIYTPEMTKKETGATAKIPEFFLENLWEEVSAYYEPDAQNI